MVIGFDFLRLVVLFILSWPIIVFDILFLCLQMWLYLYTNLFIYWTSFISLEGPSFQGFFNVSIRSESLHLVLRSKKITPDVYHEGRFYKSFFYPFSYWNVTSWTVYDVVGPIVAVVAVILYNYYTWGLNCIIFLENWLETPEERFLGITVRLGFFFPSVCDHWSLNGRLEK